MEEKFKSSIFVKEDEPPVTAAPVAPVAQQPAVIKNPQKTYKVNALLNLRKEPSLKAEVLKVLEVGTEFKSNRENEEWVKFGNGWCMKKFLNEVK